MHQFSPRLHVLLASDAQIGLVIRRGPSKSVASVLWDRRADEFELGQWIRGRIYERRSDISPDGQFLIYFAMNGRWQSEAKGAWTAISRTPYLKAIALFPNGSCWNGGGMWTGKSKYWLNDGIGHGVLHNSSTVQRDRQFHPDENYGGECLGVYYLRLIRDGWTLTDRQSTGKWKNQDLFEKPIGKGWVLRKIAHAEIGAPPGKGCYWDEHELVNTDSSATISCPNWEWADLDGKRLVWACDGTLRAAKVQRTELTDETVFYDFNEMKFAAIKAPY